MLQISYFGLYYQFWVAEKLQKDFYSKFEQVCCQTCLQAIVVVVDQTYFNQQVFDLLSYPPFLVYQIDLIELLVIKLVL